MRARPVPFGFQSFRPEPDTSPRVFVAEVPCRAFAMKFLTAAWIKPSFSGAPKTASDNSTSPISSFFKLRTLTVGITNSSVQISNFEFREFRVLKSEIRNSKLLSFLVALRGFAHDNNAAISPGHGPSNHQQIVFSIYLGYSQSFSGDAGITHMPG